MHKAYGFIIWFFSGNASSATMASDNFEPGWTYLAFVIPVEFSDKAFDKGELQNSPPSNILPLLPTTVPLRRLHWRLSCNKIVRTWINAELYHDVFSINCTNVIEKVSTLLQFICYSFPVRLWHWHLKIDYIFFQHSQSTREPDIDN